MQGDDPRLAAGRDGEEDSAPAPDPEGEGDEGRVRITGRLVIGWGSQAPTYPEADPQRTAQLPTPIVADTPAIGSAARGQSVDEESERESSVAQGAVKAQQEVRSPNEHTTEARVTDEAAPSEAAEPGAEAEVAAKHSSGPAHSGGRHKKARVEEISLSRPWVANASTVLIALGVLLVLLAVIRVL